MHIYCMFDCIWQIHIICWFIYICSLKGYGLQGNIDIARLVAIFINGYYAHYLQYRWNVHTGCLLNIICYNYYTGQTSAIIMANNVYGFWLMSNASLCYRWNKCSKSKMVLITLLVRPHTDLLLVNAKFSLSLEDLSYMRYYHKAVH